MASYLAGESSRIVAGQQPQPQPDREAVVAPGSQTGRRLVRQAQTTALNISHDEADDWRQQEALRE